MNKLLFIMSAVLALPSVSVVAVTPAKTILYVCGGNTGRSVMAEWYTRHWYSAEFNTFSRGSGIDPDDDTATEPLARQLIIANHEATSAAMDARRATPVSILDLYKADLVLTMGSKYNDRLHNLIDRECSAFNLNYPNRSFSKEQWLAMCQDKDQIKAKIHTLVGCASGIDGEIPDAYGETMPFYQKTRSQIIENINVILTKNYKETGTWCARTSTGSGARDSRV